MSRMLSRPFKCSLLRGTQNFNRQFSAAVELPALNYSYDALEPHISGEIMEIHHSKHHQTYVTNFNAALEQLEEAKANQEFDKMISLQAALNFNGGGHINHSIFWTNLAPPKEGGGGTPTGVLAQAIDDSFGSFEEFKSKMNAATAAVQGSGWGWLGYNTSTGSLEITTKSNQDPLTELVPLLGIDIWEHAYYLQYQNVRPDYLNAIWNVINWSNVSQRFEDAK